VSNAAEQSLKKLIVTKGNDHLRFLPLTPIIYSFSLPYFFSFFFFFRCAGYQGTHGMYPAFRHLLLEKVSLAEGQTVGRHALGLERGRR
jgi:hypothetical protein